ncbi:MAG: hypothetical protein KGQ41_00820 [Alphaproteobacteria bacterium]|nr:hypothetical protein [Alphaproteobacteria bacterium]
MTQVTPLEAAKSDIQLILAKQAEIAAAEKAIKNIEEISQKFGPRGKGWRSLVYQAKDNSWGEYWKQKKSSLNWRFTAVVDVQNEKHVTVRDSSEAIVAARAAQSKAFDRVLGYVFAEGDFAERYKAIQAKTAANEALANRIVKLQKLAKAYLDGKSMMAAPTSLQATGSMAGAAAEGYGATSAVLGAATGADADDIFVSLGIMLLGSAARNSSKPDLVPVRIDYLEVVSEARSILKELGEPEIDAEGKTLGLTHMNDPKKMKGQFYAMVEALSKKAMQVSANQSQVMADKVSLSLEGLRSGALGAAGIEAEPKQMARIADLLLATRERHLKVIDVIKGYQSYTGTAPAPATPKL